MTVLHSLVASSGTVTFFKGWDFTGNYTFVDLVAASTNALNGALLARRPDHFKNFTIVGILGMALLGGPRRRDHPGRPAGRRPVGAHEPRLHHARAALRADRLLPSPTRGPAVPRGAVPVHDVVLAPLVRDRGRAEGRSGRGFRSSAASCSRSSARRPGAGTSTSRAASRPKQFIRGEWFVTIAALTGLVWILVYWASGNTWIALAVAFVVGYIGAGAGALVRVGGAARERAEGRLQALGRPADARPQAEGKVAARAPRPRSARTGCRFARRGRGRARNTDRRELMADTPTDVLVGGLPGHRRSDEGLRRARQARRGQEGRRWRPRS